MKITGKTPKGKEIVIATKSKPSGKYTKPGSRPPNKRFRKRSFA